MALLPNDREWSARSGREEPPLRLEAVPRCPVCGGSGKTDHTALTDRHWGVPGEWRYRRCEADGALWLDPRPVEADRARCYPSIYFTHESTQNRGPAPVEGLKEQVRRSILATSYGYTHLEPGNRLPVGLSRILALIPSIRAQAIHQMGACMVPFRPDGKLLDVGCGSGDYLERMRGYGWEVAGIEPDLAAAQVARGEHALDVHAGTVDDAPFASGSFDAVTCRHVLEHIDAPREFLQAVARFLKPGGRLILVTPNAASLGHRFFGRDFYSLDPPRHLVLYTPQAVRRLCDRLPWLRVISVRTPTHIARKIFKQGRIVRKHGSFRAEGVRLTAMDKLGAVLLSTAESAATPLWPLGEEIELVAETQK